MGVSGTHGSCDSIFLDTLKGTHLVEVLIAKFSFLDHLGIEAALELHHEQEHVTIRTAGKENLARVKLIKCAAD